MAFFDSNNSPQTKTENFANNLIQLTNVINVFSLNPTNA